MDKNTFEDLASKVSNLLPPAPEVLKKEFEDNVRRIIHRSFERLDLVTREEFDVQQAVLQRTRLKLETLELKVAEFEQKLAENQSEK